ncbi:MAG TPA: hypothetical protein VHD37_02285 [Candidatus Paceibacterota bacterium]|nr:hypothetical protein [Candidatus Paceibacterota bacterium]
MNNMILRGVRPVFASDAGSGSGSGKPAASSSNQQPDTAKTAPAQPAPARRPSKIAMQIRAAGENLVVGSREAGRAKFMPLLDEARRSAVQSRVRADKLEREVETALADLDPGKLLDKVMKGWDDDLKELDQKMAAYEANLRSDGATSH